MGRQHRSNARGRRSDDPLCFAPWLDQEDRLSTTELSGFVGIVLAWARSAPQETARPRANRLVAKCDVQGNNSEPRGDRLELREANRRSRAAAFGPASADGQEIGCA